MIEITIALIIFLFPLAYSPGPGNMFFAANGARFGFAATVPSNIGYHIATWLVTVVIGLDRKTSRIERGIDPCLQQLLVYGCFACQLLR